MKRYSNVKNSVSKSLLDTHTKGFYRKYMGHNYTQIPNPTQPEICLAFPSLKGFCLWICCMEQNSFLMKIAYIFFRTDYLIVYT